MNEAIKLLDAIFEHRELEMKELMRRGKDLTAELDALTEKMTVLNQEMIEINNARVVLRKHEAKKDK